MMTTTLSSTVYGFLNTWNRPCQPTTNSQSLLSALNHKFQNQIIGLSSPDLTIKHNTQLMDHEGREHFRLPDLILCLLVTQNETSRDT